MIVDNVLYVQDANSHYHPAAANAQGQLQIEMVSSTGVLATSKEALKARTDIATDASTFLKCETTGALQTSLVGYDDITDVTTAKRLLTKNGGLLQTQVVGSNDINGGGPIRHLTIDGNGRVLTYPYEHPNSWTNTYLERIAYPQRKTDVINTDSAGASLNSEIGQNEYTASIDMTEHRHIRIVIVCAETVKELSLWGSNSNGLDSTFIKISDIYALSNGGYDTMEKDIMYAFLRVKGNSTGFVGISASGFTAHKMS